MEFSHIFEEKFETDSRSNSVLMDCSPLVTHKAIIAVVYKWIVCFLVALLCHTSPSISVSFSVKYCLSQLPITIH